jgi:hypothetical protein
MFGDDYEPFTPNGVLTWSEFPDEILALHDLKSKAKADTAGVSGVNVEKLLAALGIVDINDTGRESISFRCPFHDDENPSAGVSRAHGGFKCHAASCGRSYSLVGFYEAMTGVSYMKARRILRHECGAQFKDRVDESSTSDSSTNGRRLKLTSSSEVKPEVVRWFWMQGIGWIPSGGLTLVAGDPGEGKGLFSCWIAAQATQGRRGFPRVGVGMLGHEDSKGILKGRLDAAGGGPVTFLDLAGDGGGAYFMTFPTDIGLLADAIELDNLGLVIVDPINNHTDADIRVTDDKDLRRALSPLNALGQELDCAIIAVHHLSKGTVGQKMIYRAGGAIAYSGAARQVLFLGALNGGEDEEEDDPNARFIFQGKTNYSPKTDKPLRFVIEEREVEIDGEPEKVPAFTFWGEDETVKREDVFSPPRGRGRPKDDRVRAWIEEYLDEREEVTPQAMQDAAEAAGHGRQWRTIRHIVHEELNWTTERLEGQGRNAYVWCRPMATVLQLVPGRGRRGDSRDQG